MRLVATHPMTISFLDRQLYRTVCKRSTQPFSKYLVSQRRTEPTSANQLTLDKGRISHTGALSCDKQQTTAQNRSENTNKKETLFQQYSQPFLCITWSGHCGRRWGSSWKGVHRELRAKQHVQGGRNKIAENASGNAKCTKSHSGD